VNSELIRLDPLPPDQLPEPILARRTEALLRRCFAARRKMLRNTLAGLLPEVELQQAAKAAGITLNQRPQELGPERWLALAAVLDQLQGSPSRCNRDLDNPG
jgi:16S rRNA (adenine1518-N6/adenine1519-N6)-dimethyltransferase